MANIVAIHEIGEHDGQHYFSMDYVEGRNLSDMIAGKSAQHRDFKKLAGCDGEICPPSPQQGNVVRRQASKEAEFGDPEGLAGEHG